MSAAVVDEPVFVCGLGRSGTTWLARSLGQSPELAYVGEAWLVEKLEELASWHRVLHDEWGGFTTWRGSGVGREPFVRALARFYGDLLVGAAGGKRFVEKTPEWNVFHLPFLVELFPRARYVLLYRDGRNYVASSEAKRRRTGEDFEFGAYCRRWARAMRIFDEATRARSPEHARLVRYEDLLDDFDGVFATLCEFVGIPPIRPRPMRPNSAFAEHRTREHFNRRWHAWSEEQKAIFRSHAGEELVRWRYVGRGADW